MLAEGDWEGYLRTRFPGYLLPESGATSLTVEEATRFLETLTGRSDQLQLLRATSFLAPKAERLRTFVEESLVDLVRSLPSRTESYRREWEGGFHGRLLIRDTVALRLQGRQTSFVTRSHVRVFDLPENILVRAVCVRLLSLIVLLRKAEVLGEDSGWGLALRGCEGTLRRLLVTTALRDVPERPCSIYEENAARAARGNAYHEAATWSRWFREELDNDTPARIAQLVADGALLPLKDYTRFELAVTIRLADGVREELAGLEHGHWRTEHAVVIGGRKEVIAFVRDDGLAIRVFYNHSHLPAGMADLGGRHYLGNQGRLRPDVTMTFERGKKRTNAVVIECKHSPSVAYLLEGYHEAVLYRWEYSAHLHGIPKAILVTSGGIAGLVREDDEVIVVGWPSWPPRSAVKRLVRDFLASE